MKIYALNSSVFDDNDALFAEKLNTLSVYRQNKIYSCKYFQDRKRSLAAGVLTDIALSRFGLKEKDMYYSENENGKPYFVGYDDIFFSLSHSGNWAIAAFSDCEIGCDIQQIKDVNLNIAKRYFTSEEYEYIIASKDKVDSFFSLWSRKESYIKAIGTGLSTSLKSFNVFEIADWQFKEYDDIAGYKIAVCSKEYPTDNIIVCEI